MGSETDLASVSLERRSAADAFSSHHPSPSDQRWRTRRKSLNKNSWGPIGSLSTTLEAAVAGSCFSSVVSNLSHTSVKAPVEEQMTAPSSAPARLTWLSGNPVASLIQNCLVTLWSCMRGKRVAVLAVSRRSWLPVISPGGEGGRLTAHMLSSF